MVATERAPRKAEFDDSWSRAEQEWRDPANWRGGLLGVYFAPKDPRIWVRKRQPHLGWTFNYAHRASWYWTFAMLAASVAAITTAVLMEG